MLVFATFAEIVGHPVHDHLLDIFASIVAIGILGATVEHFAPAK